MNKQLQNFFDNTKQLHILLCVALLLIIIVRVAPIGSRIKNGGQLLIVGILIYILFQNFIETHNFVLEQKRIEKDRLKRNKKLGKNSEDYISDDTMIDIKNNTIASYVLCGFIFILLAYVIYSIFD